MAQIDTRYFGTLSSRDESVFEFPAGLPGFENDQQFVLIELPRQAPLVFLQSLSHSDLCFLAFPILVVDPGYHLAVTGEDLIALDLDPGRQPELATEVLVLALVSMHDGFSATANLMAPIVVNLQTRRGLQAIRQDSSYSHQHPVQRPVKERAC